MSAGHTVADAALQRGNLQLVEHLCRDALDVDPEDTWALILLARVAMMVGRPDVARLSCQRVLAAQPDHNDAQTGLRLADRHLGRLDRAATPQADRPKYLLVKAWGYGFWADVDHVAGQLLLADITGRIPVVWWGENSLFGGSRDESAFDHYFEPVSGTPLSTLESEGLTYFPPKWSRDNLRHEDVHKWRGPFSRLSGLYVLGRDDDVVVSDFYTALADLLPWIPETSQYAGLDREAVYRRLFAEHLRVRPHLRAQVDQFWRANMAGHEWLAVHVRGSDKVVELARLEQRNHSYHRIIQEHIATQPDLRIFLLTDSEPAVRDYAERYGDRLLHTSCIRSDNNVGVHYAGHPAVRVAEEVILDTLLAGRCQRFLGNGASTLSATVLHLRDWPEGAATVLGDNVLAVRNRLLHDW